MARPFKLPDLGEGIHEAEVVAILVKEGDRVREGQPFMEVETDKARVELPSPYDGVVEAVRVKQDDTIRVGTVLVEFAESEGAESRLTAERSEKAVGAVGRPASPKPKAGPATDSGGAGAPPAEVADRVAGPVPASPATRRLARELGVVLREVPPSGPAGLVTAEDVRAFAERAVREKEGAAAPLPPVPPSGPTEAPEAPAPGTAMPPSAELPELPDFSRWGAIETAPLRSVRRATARHMALAWSQIPHVSHQDVADVTALDAFRRGHKGEVEGADGQLTMTVFVMKAAVAALKQYPSFNSSLDVRAQQIILKRYYHIGVAVDTDRGLVVPVIRDVDRKSIAELATELKVVAERARTGETPLEEMQGGTFTITNIGAIGGTGFAPIVNHPEVAILGMGRARLQPVVRGNEIEYQIAPRLMMPLILAFDHRVLDGADAARFMRTMIELLENPDRLWLRI